MSQEYFEAFWKSFYLCVVRLFCSFTIVLFTIIFETFRLLLSEIIPVSSEEEDEENQPQNPGLRKAMPAMKKIKTNNDSESDASSGITNVSFYFNSMIALTNEKFVIRKYCENRIVI